MIAAPGSFDLLPLAAAPVLLLLASWGTRLLLGLILTLLCGPDRREPKPLPYGVGPSGVARVTRPSMPGVAVREVAR